MELRSINLETKNSIGNQKKINENYYQNEKKFDEFEKNGEKTKTEVGKNDSETKKTILEEPQKENSRDSCFSCFLI